MNNQIPLIEVPVLQCVLRPPKPTMVYLVATYREDMGLQYWKVWPEKHDTAEAAEEFACKLGCCWTHIRILGPVVLE